MDKSLKYYLINNYFEKKIILMSTIKMVCNIIVKSKKKKLIV